MTESSSKSTSVRFPIGLYQKLEAYVEEHHAMKNEVICTALERFIAPVDTSPGDDMTAAEKKSVLTNARRLNDSLNNAILDRMSRDKRFIEDMSSGDFAKLVAGRLPKELPENAELDADVLSLSDFLGKLPSMDDVTDELKKAKGALKKVEFERDMNFNLLRKGKDSEMYKDLMTKLYELIVQYVWDILTRNDIPGIGDGGGLTEKGRADVAKRVEKDIEELKLYRDRH